MTELTAKQNELLDELLKDFKGGAWDFLAKEGLLVKIAKRAVEAALDGEMTHHLGYSPHEAAGRNSGNSRNGHAVKRIESELGSFNLVVPRDRNGAFKPQISPKRKRRIAGLDEAIIRLYAQGLPARAVEEGLKRLYEAGVSRSLISAATASVLEDVKNWQSLPLDPVYPIVFFDALSATSREKGAAKERAVFAALARDMQGERYVLGLWIAPAEGAVSWLNILSELKERGMRHCFIAYADGLQGLPEAIETVYPRVQAASVTRPAGGV